MVHITKLACPLSQRVRPLPVLVYCEMAVPKVQKRLNSRVGMGVEPMGGRQRVPMEARHPWDTGNPRAHGEPQGPIPYRIHTI